MRFGLGFSFVILLLVSCTTSEVPLGNAKLKVFEEFRFEPNTLQAIQERSRLRAITYFDSMSYFINEGTEMGFEYTLASEFADWLGVELEIVIPPSSSAVYDWLEDNGGDLIILPHDRTRLLPGTLKLSENYASSYDVVMTRASNQRIQTVQDLHKKTVYVIRKSQQFHALNQLIQNKQLDINIKQLPEDHSDEELLELLAKGSVEAIAIEGRFANLALQSKYKDLRIACPISDERPVAWVLPSHSDKLEQRLNQFLNLHYHMGDDGEPKRSTFYNLAYRQYFESADVPRWHSSSTQTSSSPAKVSKYDNMVRTVAEDYGLDWRLLLAVIYEESRFKSNAESLAGAKGLMQLMPETFESLGFVKIYDTEENIRAGAAYLKSLFRGYTKDSRREDQILRFVIASYNAGPGHLDDARQLAETMGWQKDSWHGGIKQAMKLLSDKRYYTKVPHGYCHGTETVAYVRRVVDRYNLFRKFFLL